MVLFCFLFTKSISDYRYLILKIYKFCGKRAFWSNYREENLLNMNNDVIIKIRTSLVQ